MRPEMTSERLASPRCPRRWPRWRRGSTRRERGHHNMRSDFREVADALDRAGALANTVTPEDAADTIYALAGHDVYVRLTRECGWTRARYAAWLADTLPAALTHAARPR